MKPPLSGTHRNQVLPLFKNPVHLNSCLDNAFQFSRLVSFPIWRQLRGFALQKGKRSLCSPTHYIRQTSLVIGRSHSLTRSGNGWLGYNRFLSPSPTLALAQGLCDPKSPLGSAPVSLSTARGGYKDESWECHTFTSGRTGEEKLRMENVVPSLPAALAPLRAFAGICRGLSGLGQRLGARRKRC